MPSIRHIPDGKRRSRTGCLPCRKRRRKCDEQKPRCGSCASRNVKCIYQPPTFVFKGQRGKDPSSGPETDVTPIDSVSPEGNLDIQDTISGRFGPLVDLTAQWPDLRDQQHSPSLSSYATPAQQLPPAPSFKVRANFTPPSVVRKAGPGPDTLATSSSASRNGGTEAGLLTSFIADIVPWIVSTCPGSKFANSVIGLAEREPAVRLAMIALVKARRKATDSTNSRRDFEENYSNHLDIVEAELVHVDDTLAANVARSLLCVTRLFGSRPTSWRKLGGTYLTSKGGLEEPLRYLLQMQGKIELASCILTEEPPSRSLISYLEQSVSAPNSTIRTAYLTCLCQLAQCLHLTYHVLAQLMVGSVEHPQGNPYTKTDVTGKGVEAWPSWHSLWARCLHWYQSRPLEMQPIFEFPRGHMSSESSASFPIEIYSTPIALQANMAMHLSFMVLIANKSLLLKLSRSEIHLGSASWHAQKIAGMAAWNYFEEQFDPLFVAALLLAAEKMTHESQQTALLQAFRDIESRMGIVLDDQITRLESIWRTFRHGHE